jgi:hypothetical protein
VSKNSNAKLAVCQQFLTALTPLLLSIIANCLEKKRLHQQVYAVLQGVRQVGLEIIRMSLEHQDERYQNEEVEVSCSACGGKCKKCSGLRSHQRFTLLGKVTYWRCRYRCPKCDRRFSPLDDQLGLDERHRGHSREFVCELVLLCTVVPFEKGGELFARAYGFAVSHPLAWKLSLAMGQSLYDREMKEAEKLWGERERCPEKFALLPAQLRQVSRARRIYIMMDNSKVGIQDGKRGRHAPKRPADAAAEPWRDVRALLIFCEDDHVRGIPGKRGRILKRRVVAHIGTQEEWYRLVHKAFFEEGVYWAHEVVVIADGGSGIWNLVDTLLPVGSTPKVVQILDWYHAAEHIWKVGKLLKGTDANGKATAAACSWVKGLLDYLADGQVSNVLQRLQKIRGGTAEAREELRKLINYIEEHRHRMRYGQYRKEKMLIGSGAVESAHKWVIQARCKLPGMRWSVRGANAMLRLRCAWASGRWDEIFGLVTGDNDEPPQQLSRIIEQP